LDSIYDPLQRFRVAASNVALTHHDGEVDANGNLSEMCFQDFDTLSRSLGLLWSLLRQGLGLGEGFLQRYDVGFQSIDTLGRFARARAGSAYAALTSAARTLRRGRSRRS
jgi:hypothetical protein